MLSSFLRESLKSKNLKNIKNINLNNKSSEIKNPKIKDRNRNDFEILYEIDMKLIYKVIKDQILFKENSSQMKNLSNIFETYL